MENFRIYVKDKAKEEEIKTIRKLTKKIIES